MSDPESTDTPAWLVAELRNSLKYGADAETIDMCLQPNYVKVEPHSSREERIKRKGSTSGTALPVKKRAAAQDLAKERHEKKLKTRAKGKGKAKETEAAESEATSPVEKTSSAKLAVNTKVPVKPKRTSHSPSTNFGLLSPVGSPGGSESLFIPERIGETHATTFKAPEWYLKLKPVGPAYTSWLKSTRNTQAEQSLQHMKDCIQRCEDEKNVKKLPKIFDELWHEIHKAEVKLRGIDARLLRKNFMLGPKEHQGLLGILNSKVVNYPVNLRNDVFQLYNRWRQHIFTVDLMRGIIIKGKGTGSQKGDTLDPAWPHKRTADYYGEGDLVCGQWWPTQLCTVRDGAHGSAQGGIYGRVKCGAFSIVVSGGSGYKDEDTGDEIWYSGTISKDLTKTIAKNMSKSKEDQAENLLATANTQLLIESCEGQLNSEGKLVKHPVRVIRSQNLPKSNKHRPEKGYRYDGLYDVVAYEIVDDAKGQYKFHLVRQPDQLPIRSADDMSRRPTKFEVEEYEALKL